jgi:hypothetical protein
MNLNHRSKYSAVAAAVAVACAVGANQNLNAASAVSGSTLTLAQQYVAAATTSASQNVTVGFIIGADYVQGDRVKIAITSGAAKFVNSGTPATPSGAITITNTAGSSTTTALTCANLSVIGFADETNVNYRVGAGGLANGTQCNFVLPLRVSTLTDANASLTFSSQFSTGESLEAAVTSRVVATADQFSASVVKAFAGVVDVEKARYHFAADDTNAANGISGGNESQLVLSIGNAAANVPAGAASVASVSVSVVGDFTWLDDTSSGFGTCAAGDLTTGNAQAVLNNAATDAGATVPSLNCGTLSYVISGAASGAYAGGLVTIALGKTNAATAAAGTFDRTIPAPQSYTTSVTFNYFSTGSASSALSATELASTTSAGSFTLNGSTIYVPFLPYNSSTSRVVYLTNRSDQSGGVSASAIADGTGAVCPSFNVETAKANGVTLLTAGIDAGIRACYGDNFDGKVALTIVSNIPGGKAEVFSAYNRNGSLTAVANSSNGRDSTNTRN